MNPTELFSPSFLLQATRNAREALEADLGITAAVYASADGFAVAHASAEQSDADRIAALASSISSIGNVMTQEATLGDCSSVVLTATQGLVVVRQFQHDNQDVVLIVITSQEGMLARILYRVSQMIKTLENA